MNDLVLENPGAITSQLLLKYRRELADATTATSEAVQRLRQQLSNMERNQVAIMAQKALLDTIEKDLAAAGIVDTSSQQANGAQQPST